MDSKYNLDSMILEFDDTHLYRDVRSAYLMEVIDHSKSEAEALVMEGFLQLYSLGVADFSIDMNALDSKARVQLYLNDPS